MFPLSYKDRQCRQRVALISRIITGRWAPQRRISYRRTHSGVSLVKEAILGAVLLIIRLNGFKTKNVKLVSGRLKVMILIPTLNTVKSK